MTHKYNPRRPYDEETFGPDMLESDNCYTANNICLAVTLLDAYGSGLIHLPTAELASAPPTDLNVKQMTFSAMERFVQAVDTVMNADDLDARERRDLICYWAYRYKQRDMPNQLAAAIKRCQASEFVHPTASSVVDWITGEVVPFSATQYT